MVPILNSGYLSTSLFLTDKIDLIFCLSNRKDDISVLIFRASFVKKDFNQIERYHLRM